jgi:hypothetical protein
MQKRSRFVGAEVTVLRLPPSEGSPNGDTLTVKRRLTAGEQRAMFNRMYRTVDGKTSVDRLEVGMATCVAYLVDWSLTDDDGQLVPLRGLPPEDVIAMLNSLSPEDFKEISAAIDAHSEAMESFRDAEKKTGPGDAASPSTSPLPADLVGATNGSGT